MTDVMAAEMAGGRSAATGCRLPAVPCGWIGFCGRGEKGTTQTGRIVPFGPQGGPPGAWQGGPGGDQASNMSRQSPLPHSMLALPRSFDHSLIITTSVKPQPWPVPSCLYLASTMIDWIGSALTAE